MPNDTTNNKAISDKVSNKYDATDNNNCIVVPSCCFVIKTP